MHYSLSSGRVQPRLLPLVTSLLTLVANSGISTLQVRHVSENPVCQYSGLHENEFATSVLVGFRPSTRRTVTFTTANRTINATPVGVNLSIASNTTSSRRIHELSSNACWWSGSR